MQMAGLLSINGSNHNDGIIVGSCDNLNNPSEMIPHHHKKRRMQILQALKSVQNNKLSS